jgi:hypothetical protein
MNFKKSWDIDFQKIMDHDFQKILGLIFKNFWTMIFQNSMTMIFKNLRNYVFQFLYFFDKKAGKKHTVEKTFIFLIQSILFSNKNSWTMNFKKILGHLFSKSLGP